MNQPWLNKRPMLLASAGPNGSGKTTFYNTHVRPSGIPLVNADILADELQLKPYDAANAAAALRNELTRRRETFAMETVFSDPVGDKLGFLKSAAESNYTVGLIFVGLSSVRLSMERVAMRVSQGGHDVPTGKLKNRYHRSLANLTAAIESLPHVVVFDNSEITQPFRWIAEYESGLPVRQANALPGWFRKLGKA